MGIGGILLNPNGRITKNQFWQGIVVLVAAQLLITGVSLFFPPMSSGGLALLFSLVFSAVLIYLYLCVYGKRLHDAGATTWFFCLFLLGFVILWVLSIDFFYGLFGASFFGMMMESIEIMNNEGEAAMQEFTEAYALENRNGIAYGGMAQLVVLNILTGLIPGVLLKSDPFENAHGQPVHGGVEEDFE